MSRPRLRCALYTRKSSDEGLDQAFNSLDAQREACVAYVASQSGEGWRALPDCYDDGGVSGGTMERPALQRLLQDIERGRIDVVVVYKIDRLTRALADFARMVEIFDRHDVSFVSVTQAFNTTSSMGRLTLNVLLSFAQFEREVTGERIRDKIAASKAKGMWMGGIPPLGYDPPVDSGRKLVINPEEAEIVRTIFSTYLDLGSVHALERWLDQRAIRSKPRLRRDRTPAGGQPFSRGALFHLLKNPIYLGLISHKGTLHEGLHAPIIAADLFEAVQVRLSSQRRRGKSRNKGSLAAPLTGRIFDATGAPMSPTFSIGRNGRRYRYYVTAALQQGKRKPSDDGVVRRVPAALIEAVVTARLRLISGVDPTQPLSVLQRVTVEPQALVLAIPVLLADAARATLVSGERIDDDQCDSGDLSLRIPFTLAPRSADPAIAAADRPGPRPDATLIRALRRAHSMLERDQHGQPTLTASPTSPHRRRLIRLAFLAPDIQAAILSGRQPRHLTLASLLAADIPIEWHALAKTFGVKPGTHDH